MTIRALWLWRRCGDGGCLLGVTTVWAALVCGAAAWAAEPAVVYSGGRAWPLIQVVDAVAVRDADPAGRTGKGRAAGSPDRRVRLEAVARADRAAIDALAAQPDVAMVSYAYRLREGGRPVLMTDDLVVGFAEGMTEWEVEAFCEAYGVERVRPVGRMPNAYVLRLAEANGDAAVQVAAAMYEDARTRFAHPDMIVPRRRHAVHDPYYANQWHLHNVGQYGGTVDADIDAPEAWEVTLGAGAVVAVHDDAIDTGHPDLADSVVWSWNYESSRSDPSPIASDEDHGTSVAGVAVARANSIGVRGSAPEASLIALHWGDAISQDVEALYDADDYGADVFNMSWAYDDGFLPDAVERAVEDLYVTGRSGRGLLVVVAAGNEYSLIATSSGVAAMPETLAVGASTDGDRYGEYSNSGPELDVMAPSNGGIAAITTTDVRDGLFATDGYAVGGYATDFGGTSSAAPLVSGVVALCVSVNPDLTAAQLKRLLEHTCDQIAGGYDSVTGHSNTYGYGRANAAVAVAAAVASVTNGGDTWPAPVSAFDASADADVTLTWDADVDEADSVLIVRSAGSIDFMPVDGATYTVGDQVASSVAVVYYGSAESFSDTSAPVDMVSYAAYARNAAGRWSWGRTVDVLVSDSVRTATSLAVTGQDEMVGGYSSTFAAIAYYDDGSQVTVTDQATWSALPETVLTVLSDGVVLADGVAADTIGTIGATFVDGDGGVVTGSLDVVILATGSPADSNDTPLSDSISNGGTCGAMSMTSVLGVLTGLLLMGRLGRRRW